MSRTMLTGQIPICILLNLQVLLAVLRGKQVVSAASSAALRALRTSLDMTPSVATGQLPDKHVAA
jgi:hypothetical protein